MATFYNAKQVQERLGISETTLWRLLKRKQIKGFKVGREWRFEEKDIEDFVQQQRANTERSEDAKKRVM